MKLRYLKQASLDELKSALPSVVDRFTSEAPWLDDFFGSAGWSLESQVVTAKELALAEPEGNNHYDLENAKRVHECLKGISIAQATDERLWTYLALVPCWSYMRKRWPVENYEDKDASAVAQILRERYFFLANRDRALVRNGIARLWWYGHVSYDADRADPYELTKVLLDKLDVAQSLLERSFSRNPTVCKAVLNFMHQQEQQGNDMSRRDVFRALMQHLNRLGGMAMLDLLSQHDIESELAIASASASN
jgi:hypothetical protein